MLSAGDWQHWISKGFVVIRGVVPQAQCDAVADMLWQFQDMDPADPSTWDKKQLREHKMTELNNAGMVEVYNHQSLWDTRQNRRVYDIFVDIWDREDLWVAIDRANLNPPNKAARETGRTAGFIHFDVDISQRPLPIAVQGILSLKKQGGAIGGFQCVPSIFAEIDEWWGKQPAGANPFKPDVGAHPVENITLEVGDMLIFNSQLAHGVRPNVSDNDVRMAQYISMFPADFGNESCVRPGSRLGPSRRIRSGTRFLAIRAGLRKLTSKWQDLIRWGANYWGSTGGGDGLRALVETDRRIFVSRWAKQAVLACDGG